MPRISDKISIKNELLDRRVKLTAKEKEEIRQKYWMNGVMASNYKLHKAVSQRTLAKEYGVSRRTIVFVLYPERRTENVKVRNARGGSKVYYNKYKPGEWARIMRNHRNYKKELYIHGLI